MGGVLGDSNVGDVCLEHYRRKQGSVPYAYEADFSRYEIPATSGFDAHDPSTSFLMKQLSMMRRFSSSNRWALLSMAAR